MKKQQNLMDKKEINCSQLGSGFETIIANKKGADFIRFRSECVLICDDVIQPPTPIISFTFNEKNLRRFHETRA